MVQICETQRLNHYFSLKVFLLAILIISIFYPYYTSGKFDFIVIAIILLVILFLYLIRIEYKISEKSIQYKFFPLMWNYKKIPFEKVDTIEAITYSPLKDFGGWGIRIKGSVRAYTIGGTRGILIKLNSGKTILIGTQLDIVQLNQKLDQLKTNLS